MLRRSAGLFKTKFENAAWGLELQSYGFGDHQTALTGTPAVKADDQRLSYLWDANVQEWFINEPRGLGHGFTVNERPAAALNAQFSTLNFHLAPPAARSRPPSPPGTMGPRRAGAGRPHRKPKTAPFLHRFCTASPFCPVQFRPAHANPRISLQTFPATTTRPPAPFMNWNADVQSLAPLPWIFRTEFKSHSRPRCPAPPSCSMKFSQKSRRREPAAKCFGNGTQRDTAPRIGAHKFI